MERRKRVVADDERLRRGLMHIPVGVFGAWLMERDKHSGWAFWLSFWGYELVEQRRIGDGADIDILGANAGWAAYKLGKAVWNGCRKSRNKGI